MSQVDSQKQYIDGDEYEVFMLDPMTANDLLIDIGGAIGPALGAFAGASDGNDLLDSTMDGEKLGDGVALLFKGLDKAIVRRAIQSLSEVTTVTGKGKLNQIQAIQFRGKIGTMYKWLGFALKVQYSDFLGSMRDVIALAGRPGAVPRSESQSTN